MARPFNQNGSLAFDRNDQNARMSCINELTWKFFRTINVFPKIKIWQSAGKEFFKNNNCWSPISSEILEHAIINLVLLRGGYVNRQLFEVHLVTMFSTPFLEQYKSPVMKVPSCGDVPTWSVAIKSSAVQQQSVSTFFRAVIHDFPSNHFSLFYYLQIRVGHPLICTDKGSRSSVIHRGTGKWKETVQVNLNLLVALRSSSFARVVRSRWKDQPFIAQFPNRPHKCH